MKRPYKLVWTDSCRHTQSFASYEAAYKSAREAEPCKISPCVWIIRLDGATLIGGAA